MNKQLIGFVLICSCLCVNGRSRRHRDVAEVEVGGKDKSSRAVHIRSLHVRSVVYSRFTTTLITSRLANSLNKPTEANFVVQLPEDAFISNFTMQIGNKIVIGNVKEKEVAKAEYDREVSRGNSAALVAQAPRETNTFQISVNVGASEKVTFNLTYQEMLVRCHGVYKHVLNIKAPQKEINDLKMIVDIYEQHEISQVHVPVMTAKTGQSSNQDLMSLEQSKSVDVNLLTTEAGSHAHVQFTPNKKEQKKMLNEDGHISTQMVVLYDVHRENNGGQLQAVNGYFVHFFAPSELPVAGKRVVFVIDTSGSMQGRKMEQTKEAMDVILRDLNANDEFTVVEFDSEVRAMSEFRSVTNETIEQAVAYVNQLTADGGTDINAAMMKALELCAGSHSEGTLVSTVIFMTDGQPTAGETNADTMVSNLIKSVDATPVSVHTISFGMGADYNLMKRFSIATNGVAKKVYEDSDADLQMQGFYAQISSPMLTDVKITYLNDTFKIDSVVQDMQKIYYEGTEIVVVGRFEKNDETSSSEETSVETTRAAPSLVANINGLSKTGAQNFRTTCIPPPYWPRPIPYPFPEPVPEQAPLDPNTLGGFIERMWAYRSIKQALDDWKYKEATQTQKTEYKERALELSLKYNFVTELTSMVVVQDSDNENDTVVLDKAPSPGRSAGGYSNAGVYGNPHSMMVSGSRSMAGMSSSRGRVNYKHGMPGPAGVNLLSASMPDQPYVRPPRPTTTTLRPLPTIAVCALNETLSASCEASCGEVRAPVTQVCAQTAGRCTCEFGFVRGPNGNCIDPLDCPGVDVTCPDNATLVRCGPTCGVATCESFSGITYEGNITSVGGLRACPAGCAPPVCVCNAGLVFGPDGDCIQTRHCPQLSCTEHEVIGACGNKCELTCEQGNLTCATVCEAPACTCKKGYRRHQGQCVQTCPSDARVAREVHSEESLVCDSDTEEVNSCGDLCERKCGDANPKVCVLMCAPPACVCKGQLVRNAHGDCVPESECADHSHQQLDEPELLCSVNEIVNECGNLCEPKCGDAERMPCVEMCAPAACVCDEGFVRNEDGECIEASECERTSSEQISESAEAEAIVCSVENEVVKECGRICEPTCADGHQQRMCKAVCGSPACMCDTGFVRNIQGECVRLEQCPNQANTTAECGENEVMRECGNHCEHDCSINGGGPRRCYKVCRPRACACKHAFARHNGICVPVHQCPTGEPVAPECGENEQMSVCGRDCERDCSVDGGNARECAADCDVASLPAACACQQGFTRHQDRCIPNGLCPRQTVQDLQEEDDVDLLFMF